MQSDIWLADTSGAIQQLTTSGFNTNETFSWDGTTINYIFTTQTGMVSYLMNCDGSNKRPVPYRPPGLASTLQWSPDGSLISFGGKYDSSVVLQPVFDVYVTDPQGKNVRRITFDGHSSGARWSPDGTKLAYISGPPQDNQDIFTINPDGTGQRQVTTHGKVNVGALQWSPDGKQIAYAFEAAPSTLYIHVVDLESAADFNTGVELAWGYHFEWKPN